MGERWSCLGELLQLLDGVCEESFAHGAEQRWSGRLRCEKTVGAGVEGFFEVFLVVLFQ